MMVTVKSKSARIQFAFALTTAALFGACGGPGSDSTTKAISAFSLDGNTGQINEAAKSIAVAVPAATNVTAMTATFTTSGASVDVGATPQVSGTTKNNFTSAVMYTVSAADGTTAAYTVTVTVGGSGNASSNKTLSAFSISGSPGVIDQAAKTVAVTLAFNTNVTALVATFLTSGASVKVGAAAQTSGTTANDFAAPVAYTVTAADGSTETYTATVILASMTAKAFTAFVLFGASGSVTGLGSIDEAAKTITVPMPVGYDVTALVATFATTGASVSVGATSQTSGTTANNFSNAVSYTVTAFDASTQTYSVSVLATTNPTAPPLGEAGRFVILASQAITTTGTTAISNGDIGIIDIARTGMAGFTPMGAAGDFVELSNGTSFAADDANPAPFPYPLHYSTNPVGAAWTTSGAMITQVRTDLGIANTFLGADPNPTSATTVCPTELGGLVLTRGVYKTAANVAVSGPLHLDAQGDPNSVFIITVGGTLTFSGDIVLDGGALAKNVYWRTASSASIAVGTIFKGQLFAGTRIDVLSGAAITGSLFAVTDRVTLIADTVTKAP